MNEELAIELEALQCTYGDALSVDGPGRVVAAVAPRSTPHFCRARVAFTIPEDYPAETPGVMLQNVKGESPAA
jgi:hypothetical protein